MSSLSSLHVILAEGNPDEEKIGAFGVGESHHCLEPKKLLHGIPVGFYSLFSVTEEPWVTSGGKLALLLARSQRFHMH